MSWRTGLACVLLATAAVATNAHACTPQEPLPRLAGESDDAYKTRTDAVWRGLQATWLKQRQSDDLQRATVIFIARDTAWAPPQKPRYRNGRLLPPVVPAFRYPPPSYYKPIDWFRGPKSTDLFKLDRGMTSCGGAVSVGDASFSEPRTLFVFFASKWPATEDTLIDAIALDRINDPALMDFVARYRGKSPPVVVY